MKPWIKILIAAVGGFAGGFAAGFLFGRKSNDIQIEEVSEEEFNNILAEAEAKQSGNVANDPEQHHMDILNNKITASDLDPDHLRITLQGKTEYKNSGEDTQQKYSTVHNVYQRYSDTENADNLPVEDEDFDEEFMEALEQEEVEPGQVEPPHVISLGEYYNDRPEYDKLTLDYYEGDNTWIDENDEIIADISSYVGLDATKLFSTKNKDDMYEDPDVRFVRYEAISTDFELIRHHIGYHEQTEGDEG